MKIRCGNHHYRHGQCSVHRGGRPAQRGATQRTHALGRVIVSSSPQAASGQPGASSAASRSDAERALAEQQMRALRLAQLQEQGNRQAQPPAARDPGASEAHQLEEAVRLSLLEHEQDRVRRAAEQEQADLALALAISAAENEEAVPLAVPVDPLPSFEWLEPSAPPAPFDMWDRRGPAAYSSALFVPGPNMVEPSAPPAPFDMWDRRDPAAYSSALLVPGPNMVEPSAPPAPLYIPRAGRDASGASDHAPLRDPMDRSAGEYADGRRAEDRPLPPFDPQHIGLFVPGYADDELPHAAAPSSPSAPAREDSIVAQDRQPVHLPSHLPADPLVQDEDFDGLIDQAPADMDAARALPPAADECQVQEIALTEANPADVEPAAADPALAEQAPAPMQALDGAQEQPQARRGFLSAVLGWFFGPMLGR